VGVGVILSSKALFIRKYDMFDPGSLIKEVNEIEGEYEKIPVDFIIPMEPKELQGRYIVDLINKTYNNQRINEDKAKFIKKTQWLVIFNMGFILVCFILACIYLIYYFLKP